MVNDVVVDAAWLCSGNCLIVAENCPYWGSILPQWDIFTRVVLNG